MSISINIRPFCGHLLLYADHVKLRKAHAKFVFTRSAAAKKSGVQGPVFNSKSMCELDVTPLISNIESNIIFGIQFASASEFGGQR